MYLPLTGYKEKDNNEVKMSIDSIGPTINTQTVSAPDAAARATDNAHKVEDQQPIKQERQELSEDQKQQAVDGFYSGTGMSTQDFMVLRTQASEEPFEPKCLPFCQRRRTGERILPHPEQRDVSK